MLYRFRKKYNRQCPRQPALGSQPMSIEREVRQVQAAQKARGYTVGVVDGLYG
jgi:peptidoglycan hydrolase-like protein with peptidoglycan-binding domain